MKQATRTALVVRGGWEGHEPLATSDRFVHLLEEAGVRTTTAESLDVYCAAERLRQFDVIVQSWTQGEITKPQLAGLTEAVAGGVGFAGWHGGIIDSFRNSTPYQFMTGGQWVAHPDRIIDYRVEVVPEHQDHPIVAGLGTFAMHSEQYYVHADPSNHVLASTTFGRRQQAPWVEGTVMPVVWVRHWGQGRVFVSTLGHVDADFEVAEARQLTLRGILWAARGESSGD